MLRTVATVLAATALAGQAQAQDAEEALTVIHAGWLLAIPGEAPLEQQSILSAASASKASRPAM